MSYSSSGRLISIFDGKADAVVVLVVGVAGVGDDVFGLVVDELAVGAQVEAAEENFAGQPTVVAVLADDVDHIVGLIERVAFFVGDGFGAIFQDRGFVGADFVQQQGLVNDLRAKVFERLGRIRAT